MKRNLVIVALLLLSMAAVAADKSAAPAFDKLKTLAGTWERKGPEGNIHTSTWSLIAAGSVMMERMEPENAVTMYHMDGARLMLTHYCLTKNQPRMVAEVSPDGKTISFNFLDITNLASPDAKHMPRMVITVEDGNHFTQEWLVREGGKERTGVLHYTRRN